ncbi:MAG: hypothetical protein NDI61_01100 [Bdellovibrionaceae bacterium]|nr:hypothetical protein [Pseudobdellovibrionaceae bacterium]
MINSIRVALVALSLLVSTSSFARSLHPDTFTRISQFAEIHIDERLNYPDFQIGHVSINVVSKAATLVLDSDIPYCPPGQICPAVVRPMPRIVRFQIVQVKTDGGCGTIRYVAKNDQRSVGGNLEILSIVDRSASQCESVADTNPYPVEVKYTLKKANDPRNLTYTSYFRGLPFNQLYAAPSQRR